MSRSLIFLFSVFCLSLSGCGNPTPSDQEMINNFENHEPEFERIRTIASQYDSFHYPPYDTPSDSIEVALSLEDQASLDSLLHKIGVERMFFYRTSSIDSSSVDQELDLLYYHWGLSITGGSKEYVYNPRLEEQMKQYEVDPTSASSYVEGIITEDLDETARRIKTDLNLYRPLRGNWYIYLSRDY